jgi:uracil-DNA glycosylase
MKTNLPDLLINDWKTLLNSEMSLDYFQNLGQIIEHEYEVYTVYPPLREVFQAFNLCSFSKTKVVIIGQDPYHGFGQAHGLCFSVPNSVNFPPSLKNIFKELMNQYNPLFKMTSGDLSPWANQGVLLLNSILTVRADQAASHSKLGWQLFTQRVIDLLNEEKTHLVFLLWGNYAQKIGSKIDRNKHLVLEASHPSPLSANRGGWFGNNHFLETNEYLVKNNMEPIHWI